MNGRASRHNSAGVQLFKPVPSRRKSTINTAPPSTDNPSRCTASITGNSHSDPTTARPSHTVSHHSKKGSNIVGSGVQGLRVSGVQGFKVSGVHRVHDAAGKPVDERRLRLNFAVEPVKGNEAAAMMIPAHRISDASPARLALHGNRASASHAAAVG